MTVIEIFLYKVNRATEMFNREGQKLHDTYEKYLNETDAERKKYLCGKCKRIITEQQQRKSLIEKYQVVIKDYYDSLRENVSTKVTSEDLNPSRFLCDKVWNRRSNR